MKTSFMQIISLSLSASLVAALVMGLRLVLKKSPRFIVCALWALVAVRLLIPALPESKVSLLPQEISSGQVVENLVSRPLETTVRVKKSDPQYVKILQSTPQLPVRYQAGEAYVEVSEATLEAPKTVATDIVPILAWIWLGGAALMLVYMAFSYLRIWRKVRISLKEEDNIYICDSIDSPFILGLIRPKIYLPSALKEGNRAYVLAHEQAHLKRLDHIWKPLGYLLLSLHWFNPLMWAAYILLCRDIEMACDEKVTGREGEGYKRAYSEALLACSLPARMVTACPLAFGEVGVKTRIKSLLHYKRPAFWILAMTLAACIIPAGCALTNPSDPATAPESEKETPTQTGESATEPAADTDSAPTEPSADPTDPQGGETDTRTVIRASLTADQEGVMEAERIYRFDTAYYTEPQSMDMPEKKASLYQDGRGPSDAAYYDWQGTFLLDPIGKRILQYANVVNALDLSFCVNPQRMMISEEHVEMEGLEQHPQTRAMVIYVLDNQTLYRLPMAWSELYEDVPTSYEAIPLPEGVTADDVIDMVRVGSENGYFTLPLLITRDQGNYLLSEDHTKLEASTAGYRMHWRDDNTLEISTEETVWILQIPRQQVWVLGEVSAESLTLCLQEEGNSRARICKLDGEHCLESFIDMSDWVSTPLHFVSGRYNEIHVLAPREEGIELVELEPGISSLRAEKPLEDLTEQRQEILKGTVVSLYEGKALEDAYGGFILDLNNDSRPEELGLGTGVGNRHVLAREWYVGGRSAGTGRLQYLWSSYGLEGVEVLWPEEATFSRETDYKLYLSTMDGENILLFMESEEQTYGLELVSYEDPEHTFRALRTRIRGLGKTMAEFTPNLSLEEYIAQGWQVCPMEGDQLDLNGDGEEEIIRMARESTWSVLPYEERIGIHEREKSYVYYQDHLYSENKDIKLRYGDLYYMSNGDQGYDLIGEISIDGRTVVERYQLIDQEAHTLEPGDDFSQASYGKTAFFYYPLPGWEGVSEKLKNHFEAMAEEKGISAGDLAELRQLFGDLFVGHFLLQEYQNAWKIDPEILFYDGIPQGIWGGNAGRLSEEEASIIRSLTESAELDNTILRRAEAYTVFMRYTDYGLVEIQKEIRFKYWEQLDAWTWSKGDTENRHYSIVDAYRNGDGTVTALWRCLWSEPGQNDKFGLVTLRKTEEGWKILSNRFLKEEELGISVTRGVLRAVGEKVIAYEYEGNGWDRIEARWNGQPVRPVDFDYQVETGYMILDQAGKRLIAVNSQGSVATHLLDFCSYPVQMALVYGEEDTRLFILDGKEVLSTRLKRSGAYELTGVELDKRIPLPEGLHASDVWEIRNWTMPGSSGAQVLLLITKEKGNYILGLGATAFGTTEQGWRLERQGDQVSIYQEEARWILEDMQDKELRVLDINTLGASEQHSLTVFVREQDAPEAEIRTYQGGGMAVSSLDLSGWAYADCQIQGSGEKGYIMAPKKTGLYVYYVEPGLYRLESEPGGCDYSFQWTEGNVLGGALIPLPELSSPVENMYRGLFLDFDGDGKQDMLSLERSLNTKGQPGLELYFNGRSTGVSQLLKFQGAMTEKEEPCFFTAEDEYSFYLASLDGKSISLIMSNDFCTLAVEFVKLKSGIGGMKGGYMARVRMRGEGKTIEDFVPCQGIKKYLEEGWEVRPSEGDRIVMAPGGEEMIVHMDYLIHTTHAEGSYYTESIRVDEYPGTLLGIREGEFDRIYHRFDHLSYVINDHLGDLTILQGRMEDGSHETIYRLDNVNGVIGFRSAGPFSN